MYKESEVSTTRIVILKEKEGIPTKIKLDGREYALLPPSVNKEKKKSK